MTGPRTPFHVTLHVRPNGSWNSQSQRLDDSPITALSIPQAKLDLPFPISFEDACDRLANLPRLFIEPDGTFVWVCDAGTQHPWQVDGMLFDRHERLLYVELKGTCPRPVFTALLAACGLPAVDGVVQLVRQGIVLDIDEFCRTRMGDG